MWRDFYSRFSGRFSGPKALHQAAEQNRLERFVTFLNFKLSAERCGQELHAAGLSVSDWCARCHDVFPHALPRNAPDSLLRKADDLVLERTTRGSPKAWNLRHDAPEDERAYRELLYRNNLDLLFHRIFYWADGKRSLTDIMQRLEIEMDELLGDTSISRTSSGLAIAGKVSPGLDFEALLALVDQIVANGYLRVKV